jgi:hypothetical protein
MSPTQTIQFLNMFAIGVALAGLAYVLLRNAGGMP